MLMVAILVMWYKHSEQTFIPPPHGGSACNLVSSGPAVSEEMSFENVDGDIYADSNNGPLPVL